MNIKEITLLENIQNEVVKLNKVDNEKFIQLENYLSGLESKYEDLQMDLKSIMFNFNKYQEVFIKIKLNLEELEFQNFDRHLELRHFIELLSEDIQTLEMVAANNYSNLVRLRNSSKNNIDKLQ